MAANLNKVMLIGRVGTDPAISALPSGAAVANLSLATNKMRKDKDGNNQETTEWHRLVFYGRLAEIVEAYTNKGSPLYVEGELRTRQWEKDGQKHYTTEIVVNEMQMLDHKGKPSDVQGTQEHSSNASNEPPF